MRIHVVGRPKKISLKLIKESLNFYVDCLLSQRLKENIYVTVEFSQLFKEERIYGDCGPEHLEDNVPRDFIMRVDSDQSVPKILRTIAHESAHLAQYASGILKDYVRSNNKMRWAGDIYECQDTWSDYFLCPWEIEASGYENNLYRLFVITKKKRNS